MTAALRTAEEKVIDLRRQPSGRDVVLGKDVIDIRHRVRAGNGRTRLFNVIREGSTAEAAFTAAVEHDRWRGRANEIALKRDFVVADKPKGVSGEHFIRWIECMMEDPDSLDIPEHHKSVVEAAAKIYANPAAPALAIMCSWSETSNHLWDIGYQIRRGKRRPVAYRFIGTVAVR